MNEDYLNGEKITPADKKFIIAHLQDLGFIGSAENLTKPSVTNPFSGAVLDANPLEKCLVDFVQNLSDSNFRPDILEGYKLTQGDAVQKFDRARYLLMKINREMYMAILD